MTWAELEPGSTGTYALWMHLNQPCCLRVGRLGHIQFPVGDYFYLGSAHGSGGLPSRLERHIRLEIKFHWHIDHLRAVSSVKGALVWVEAERLESSQLLPGECLWSQALLTLPGAYIPAPGFGSQDCLHHCISHLVYFPQAETTLIFHTLQRFSPNLRWLYPT